MVYNTVTSNKQLNKKEPYFGLRLLSVCTALLSLKRVGALLKINSDTFLLECFLFEVRL